MSAARRTLDSICDDLRAGAPLTTRMQAQSFAALRDLRERNGDKAAGDAAARIRTVVLVRAACLLIAKSMRPDRARRSGAPRGVPATAAQLRRMQSEFIATLRARNISIT